MMVSGWSQGDRTPNWADQAKTNYTVHLPTSMTEQTRPQKLAHTMVEYLTRGLSAAKGPRLNDNLGLHCVAQR